MADNGINNRASDDGGQENARPTTERRRTSGSLSSCGVANFTPEQLARKRANDREAQRAIRERTKNQIERLKNQVHELESQQVYNELQTLLRQKDAVQAENDDIRQRLASVRCDREKVQGGYGDADNAVQKHGYRYPTGWRRCRNFERDVTDEHTTDMCVWDINDSPLDQCALITPTAASKPPKSPSTGSCRAPHRRASVFPLPSHPARDALPRQEACRYQEVCRQTLDRRHMGCRFRHREASASQISEDHYDRMSLQFYDDETPDNVTIVSESMMDHVDYVHPHSTPRATASANREWGQATK
ncbi:hypothetical protein H2199_008903 [Coniosporium tulheliwenetii]|uniref:Uncharacterized protein n=1 Tax=Coniosporium tulheliwenetii TaxID=3383036 RepID=A0ACC2YH19_9PEZI|nr:hypothetical protein H2199_008903 [Cladosporium sp. JES 115]